MDTIYVSILKVFDLLTNIVTSMISRRDKLLNYPWQQQRFEQHKNKVLSAKAAIDMRAPTIYSHVVTKPKKVQTQKERLEQIERENLRLLQKLGEIMKTKRIENVWLEPRPNFLNREKMFTTRSISSLPKLVRIYSTASENRKSVNFGITKASKRCPTCKGMSELTTIAIPEQRVPWAPPNVSINALRNEELPQKQCIYCGHKKVNFV